MKDWLSVHKLVIFYFVLFTFTLCWCTPYKRRAIKKTPIACLENGVYIISWRHIIQVYWRYFSCNYKLFILLFTCICNDSLINYLLKLILIVLTRLFLIKYFDISSITCMYLFQINTQLSSWLLFFLSSSELFWSPVVRPSVCLSVCLSVCKLFTFSSSPQEPLGQFQPNLVQSILGWWGFKVVQMKGPTLFQGEIITK